MSESHRTRMLINLSPKPVNSHCKQYAFDQPQIHDIPSLFLRFLFISQSVSQHKIQIKSRFGFNVHLDCNMCKVAIIVLNIYVIL